MNLSSFNDIAASLNVTPKYLQYILFKKKTYTIKEIPKKTVELGFYIYPMMI